MSLRIHSSFFLRVSILFCLIPLVSGSIASAQSYVYATGSPTFTTAEPVELGFINVANGNLHIEVPVASIPQRGSIPYAAKFIYDGRIWTKLGTAWSPTNVLNSQGGWRFVTSVDKGTVDTNQSTDYCDEFHQYTSWGDFTWTQSDGTKRIFPITTIQYGICPGTNISSGNAFATDSSGYHMYVTNYSAVTIYSKDGTIVCKTGLGSGTFESKDTNGNYHSRVSGNIVDTLGRTPITITTNGNQTTYAILNSQGVSTSNVTVTTTTVNYNTAFNQSGVTDVSGSFTAIQSIALPDSTSFSFTYDSGTGSGNYGLLKKITLPTGGTVDYVWTTFTDVYGNKNRWVNTRTPSPGGLWTYAPATCGSTCQKVTITKPSSDVAVHTFTMNNGAWRSQENLYTGASSLQMTLLTDYDFSDPNGRYIRTISNTTQIPTVGGATLTKKVEYTYDNPTYANLAQISEWLWYTGTPSSADRKTTIAYLTTQSYLDKNILNRPSSVTVATGAGAWFNQTKIQYDTTTLASASAVQWTDPGTTVRGNPSLVQRLLASGASCPSTTCLQTTLTYDLTGQMRSVTDPKGNATSMAYTDSFYNDNGANPPQTYSPTGATNAYLTQLTLPIIGTASFGYYFNTGKLAASTDQNSANSYQHYIDSLDRLTHLYGPTVNSARAWKLFEYPSATQRKIYTGVNDTTAATTCTSCRKDVVTLDGMGRGTNSNIPNDPDGATSVDTSYDSSGRVVTVSNPYRASGNGSDTVAYDGINRPLSVTHTDANTRVMYYGASVSSNGGIAAQLCASGTYGVGYPSLSIDEAGRKRQLWSDGFGRTIEVDEPDPTSGAITNSSPATCYKYDILNNLKQVDQGSQGRTYNYDALSRVTSVTTPEANNTPTNIYYLTTSSTLCSGDSNDICYQQDGRGATSKIVYVYDALNRLTSKTYSDSTPTVTYFYDQTSYNGLTITNGKGRRTGMSDAAGTTAWSYDPAGHIATEKRTIASVTKTTDYAYAVGGLLSSISYPYVSTPDRKVVYTYSNIGRPTQASDPINSITYAKNGTYAPQGALSGYLAGYSGSFAGITVNSQYNNRLQPAVFSASIPSGTIFSQTYSFIDVNNSNKNNGNLMQVLNNLDSNRTQTFTYDYLNRVSTAQSSATAGAACWGQSFTYDRYANLYQIGATKCNAPALSLLPPSATTNRFVDSGFAYDTVGNMTNDGPPLNTAYTYNAENQMKTEGSTTMTYDGDGLRVKKSNGKLSWRLSGGGPFITTSDASGGTVKDMIFFAGRLVAERTVTGGAVNYYLVDQLGSSIKVTNQTGTTCWDADYYPFGGANIFTTTCQPVYRFAQLESDSDTSADMDYAMYRYYDHRFVRFMSADPIGGTVTNPQSWNRYAYVSNNPLSTVDPLGLDIWDRPHHWDNFDAINNGSSCFAVPGCSSTYVNGILVSGPALQAFLITDTISSITSCSAGFCGQIKQDESGQWMQLTGYQSRTALDLNGPPHEVMAPVWADIPDPTFSQASSPAITANNERPPNGQNQRQSKLNQASKAALHTFVLGQAVGTGVGCGVGVLVAAGATVATETFPLAGATIPAGCVGGGIIGFFEALPYSTLGAAADFGLTYWGH